MENRIETWRDGVLIRVKDTRTLEGQKKLKLKELHEKVSEKIEELAPSHAQRNAALGLLSQEENDNLRLHITLMRIKNDRVEGLIDSLTDLDQIENLDIDKELL